MIPLGLDLALVKTGWSAWNVDTGLIRTDVGPAKQLKGISRRRHIADSIEAVVAHVAGGRLSPHTPVLVVIENHVAAAATRQTAIGLGMLHAVVLDTLGPLGCPIVLVAPSSAKKHLAGSGKAGKDEMVATARACGYGGHQSDEADAYGLALIGHHLLGGQDHLTAHRSSCLAAVEWVVPLPERAVA